MTFVQRSIMCAVLISKALRFAFTAELRSVTGLAGTHFSFR